MKPQHSMSDYQRHQLFSKQIKPDPSDFKSSTLENQIFFEFNPHKTLPNPLPHNYRLNRLTQPPIYIRLITESSDLQQRLIQKIICLIDSTLEQYQVPCPTLLQEALQMKEIASNLSRKIETDLTRPKGFQTVRGEMIKRAIEQVLNWKKEVCSLMEAMQQIDLKAKQGSLARKTTVQMPKKPIEVADRLHTLTSSASLFVAGPKEQWTPSVSAAAKALRLAVEQREMLLR